MWTTGMGLVPLCPRSESVARVLGLIMPVGAVGSLIFTTLAGLFYDKHSTHTATFGWVCFGRACYYDSSTFLLAMSGLLFFLATLLLTFGARTLTRRATGIVYDLEPADAADLTLELETRGNETD